MAYKTWRDRIDAYVKAHGYCVDYSTPYSTRYKKYSKALNDGSFHYYFVGKGGAVRSSKHNAVTKSTSVTDIVHRKVEQWEKENS